MMALLLVFACVEEAPPDYLVDGDYEGFVEKVQPIFEERCGNSLCHGTPDRPLEIYSSRQHRADPEDVFLDEEVSEAELEKNYLRALSFIAVDGEAMDCELVRKPLDPDAGGVEHEGGVQFGDVNNREYSLLVDWVLSSLEEG